MTRLSSLVFCHSNSNKPDLLVRNKFPGEFSRVYENLAFVKKPLIFGSKVDKFQLIKASYHNMKTLSAQFDGMIIFVGVVFFLRNFGIFTQNQIFSMHYVIFSYFIVGTPLTMSFLCLYVFTCVLVMDKSMFCTLSWTFKLSFDLLLKLGAPKNRKLRKFCPLKIFELFCTKA